jgi:surface antigen
MVDMRLFQVIILWSSLLLLQNCASTGIETVKETQGKFVDMPAPSMLTENQMMTLPGMLWNGIQYMRFSLNDKEKMMHQSAVFHSLDNAEIGATTSWYSKERLAGGKVRVVHQFPESGGYCRVYQAYIKLNGAERHMTNKACRGFGERWTFLK